MTLEDLHNHKFYQRLKNELEQKLPDYDISARKLNDDEHPMAKFGKKTESLSVAQGDGFDILFNEQSIKFYLYEEPLQSTEDSTEEFNYLLELCLEGIPLRIKKYGI